MDERRPVSEEPSCFVPPNWPVGSFSGQAETSLKRPFHSASDSSSDSTFAVRRFSPSDRNTRRRNIAHANAAVHPGFGAVRSAVPGGRRSWMGIRGRVKHSAASPFSSVPTFEETPCCCNSWPPIPESFSRSCAAHRCGSGLARGSPRAGHQPVKRSHSQPDPGVAASVGDDHRPGLRHFLRMARNASPGSLVLGLDHRRSGCLCPLFTCVNPTLPSTIRRRACTSCQGASAPWC